MDTERLIRPGAGLTVSIARELLTEYGQVNAARNELIREGWRAGVTKTEIARRMGLSRSTVLLVLAGELDVSLVDGVESDPAASGADTADSASLRA
jgi:hypothetical protein